jgi:hypothetical protein
VRRVWNSMGRGSKIVYAVGNVLLVSFAWLGFFVVGTKEELYTPVVASMLIGGLMIHAALVAGAENHRKV